MAGKNMPNILQKYRSIKPKESSTPGSRSQDWDLDPSDIQTITVSSNQPSKLDNAAPSGSQVNAGSCATSVTSSSKEEFQPQIEECFTIVTLSLFEMMKRFRDDRYNRSIFKAGSKNYSMQYILYRTMESFGITGVMGHIPPEFYQSLVYEGLPMDQLVQLKKDMAELQRTIVYIRNKEKSMLGQYFASSESLNSQKSETRVTGNVQSGRTHNTTGHDQSGRTHNTTGGMECDRTQDLGHDQCGKTQGGDILGRRRSLPTGEVCGGKQDETEVSSCFPPHTSQLLPAVQGGVTIKQEPIDDQEAENIRKAFNLKHRAEPAKAPTDGKKDEPDATKSCDEAVPGYIEVKVEKDPSDREFNAAIDVRSLPKDRIDSGQVTSSPKVCETGQVTSSKICETGQIISSKICETGQVTSSKICETGQVTSSPTVCETRPTLTSVAVARIEPGAVTIQSPASLSTEITKCYLCGGRGKKSNLWDHIECVHKPKCLPKFYQDPIPAQSVFQVMQGFRYRCTHCGNYPCQTLEELRAHETAVHVRGMSCYFCGLSVETYEEGLSHMILSHCTSHMCTQCKAKINGFLGIDDFTQHCLRKHHEWKPPKICYWCMFCGMKFTSLVHCMWHIKHRVCGNCQFIGSLRSEQQCLVCKWTFFDLHALKFHLSKNANNPNLAPNRHYTVLTKQFSESLMKSTGEKVKYMINVCDMNRQPVRIILIKGKQFQYDPEVFSSSLKDLPLPLAGVVLDETMLQISMDTPDLLPDLDRTKKILQQIVRRCSQMPRFLELSVYFEKKTTNSEMQVHQMIGRPKLEGIVCGLYSIAKEHVEKIDENFIIQEDQASKPSFLKVLNSPWLIPSDEGPSSLRIGLRNSKRPEAKENVSVDPIKTPESEEETPATPPANTGNTIIINNQQGGSNSIILGGPVNQIFMPSPTSVPGSVAGKVPIPREGTSTSSLPSQSSVLPGQQIITNTVTTLQNTLAGSSNTVTMPSVLPTQYVVLPQGITGIQQGVQNVGTTPLFLNNLAGQLPPQGQAVVNNTQTAPAGNIPTVATQHMVMHNRFLPVSQYTNILQNTPVPQYFISGSGIVQSMQQTLPIAGSAVSNITAQQLPVNMGQPTQSEPTQTVQDEVPKSTQAEITNATQSEITPPAQVISTTQAGEIVKPTQAETTNATQGDITTTPPVAKFSPAFHTVATPVSVSKDVAQLLQAKIATPPTQTQVINVSVSKDVAQLLQAKIATSTQAQVTLTTQSEITTTTSDVNVPVPQLMTSHPSSTPVSVLKDVAQQLLAKNANSPQDQVTLINQAREIINSTQAAAMINIALAPGLVPATSVKVAKESSPFLDNLKSFCNNTIDEAYKDPVAPPAPPSTQPTIQFTTGLPGVLFAGDIPKLSNDSLGSPLVPANTPTVVLKDSSSASLQSVPVHVPCTTPVILSSPPSTLSSPSTAIFSSSCSQQPKMGVLSSMTASLETASASSLLGRNLRPILPGAVAALHRPPEKPGTNVPGFSGGGCGAVARFPVLWPSQIGPTDVVQNPPLHPRVASQANWRIPLVYVPVNSNKSAPQTTQPEQPKLILNLGKDDVAYKYINDESRTATVTEQLTHKDPKEVIKQENASKATARVGRDRNEDLHTVSKNVQIKPKTQRRSRRKSDDDPIELHDVAVGEFGMSLRRRKSAPVYVEDDLEDLDSLSGSESEAGDELVMDTESNASESEAVVDETNEEFDPSASIVKVEGESDADSEEWDPTSSFIKVEVESDADSDTAIETELNADGIGGNSDSIQTGHLIGPSTEGNLQINTISSHQPNTESVSENDNEPAENLTKSSTSTVHCTEPVKLLHSQVLQKRKSIEEKTPVQEKQQKTQVAVVARRPKVREQDAWNPISIEDLMRASEMETSTQEPPQDSKNSHPNDPVKAISESETKILSEKEGTDIEVIENDNDSEGTEIEVYENDNDSEGTEIEVYENDHDSEGTEIEVYENDNDSECMEFEVIENDNDSECYEDEVTEENDNNSEVNEENDKSKMCEHSSDPKFKENTMSSADLSDSETIIDGVSDSDEDPVKERDVVDQELWQKFNLKKCCVVLQHSKKAQELAMQLQEIGYQPHIQQSGSSITEALQENGPTLNRWVSAKLCLTPEGVSHSFSLRQRNLVHEPQTSSEITQNTSSNENRSTDFSELTSAGKVSGDATDTKNDSVSLVEDSDVEIFREEKADCVKDSKVKKLKEEKAAFVKDSKVEKLKEEKAACVKNSKVEKLKEEKAACVKDVGYEKVSDDVDVKREEKEACVTDSGAEKVSDSVENAREDKEADVKDVEDGKESDSVNDVKEAKAEVRSVVAELNTANAPIIVVPHYDSPEKTTDPLKPHRGLSPKPCPTPSGVGHGSGLSHQNESTIKIIGANMPQNALPKGCPGRPPKNRVTYTYLQKRRKRPGQPGRLGRPRKYVYIGKTVTKMKLHDTETITIHDDSSENETSEDAHGKGEKDTDKEKCPVAGDREIPSENLPVPSGNLPIPSGKLPIPSGKLPIPSGKLPIPSGKLPIPSGNLSIPTGKLPIPRLHHNIISKKAVRKIRPAINLLTKDFVRTDLPTGKSPLSREPQIISQSVLNKRGRGRPSKNRPVHLECSGNSGTKSSYLNDDEESSENSTNEDANENVDNERSILPKRGRGRPRKVHVESSGNDETKSSHLHGGEKSTNLEDNSGTSTFEEENEKDVQDVDNKKSLCLKRGRGRPRKVDVECSGNDETKASHLHVHGSEKSINLKNNTENSTNEDANEKDEEEKSLFPKRGRGRPRKVHVECSGNNEHGAEESTNLENNTENSSNVQDGNENDGQNVDKEKSSGFSEIQSGKLPISRLPQMIPFPSPSNATGICVKRAIPRLATNTLIKKAKRGRMGRDVKDIVSVFKHQVVTHHIASTNSTTRSPAIGQYTSADNTPKSTQSSATDLAQCPSSTTYSKMVAQHSQMQSNNPTSQTSSEVVKKAYAQSPSAVNEQTIPTINVKVKTEPGTCSPQLGEPTNRQTCLLVGSPSGGVQVPLRIKQEPGSPEVQVTDLEPQHTEISAPQAKIRKVDPENQQKNIQMTSDVKVEDEEKDVQIKQVQRVQRRKWDEFRRWTTFKEVARQSPSRIMPSGPVPVSQSRMSNVPVQPRMILSNQVQPGIVMSNQMQPGMILSNQVQPGMILSNQVQPGMVFSNQGMMLSNQVQSPLVLSNQIQPGIVSSSQAQPNTTQPQTQPKLEFSNQAQPGLMLSNQVQPGMVLSNQIQLGMMPAQAQTNTTLPHIQPKVEFPNQVQPKVEVSNQIQPGMFLSNQVQPGMILSNQAQPGFVMSNQLQPGMMLSNQIQPGMMISNQIQPGMVMSNQIQPGAVMSNQLQPGAVMSNQIQPGTVISNQLQPGTMNTIPIQGMSMSMPNQVLPGLMMPNQLQPGMMLSNPAQPLMFVQNSAAGGLVMANSSQPGTTLSSTAQSSVVMSTSSLPGMISSPATGQQVNNPTNPS